MKRTKNDSPRRAASKRSIEKDVNVEPAKKVVIFELEPPPPTPAQQSPVMHDIGTPPG